MKTYFLLASMLFCQIVFCQPDKYRMTQQDYIEKYKNDAIKDMQKTGVPASITIAQGLYESESGNSDLAREANNHFGIKCHKEWTGATFHKDDDQRHECFRKYKTVLESFDDHSDFLRTRDRYAFLFKLEITDYKGWANGLKKAGYATNPQYAEKLIKIIEDFQLYDLDKKGNNIPVLASVKNDYIKPTLTAEPAHKEPARATLYNSLPSGNHVPYVIAEKGDTYFSIANENKMMLWQVLKYNDAEKTDEPVTGEIVYTKPKKAKAKEDFYIVKEGEDMRFVAQLYGVKMKKLYNRNHLAFDAKLHPGQKILLR